MGLPRGQEWSCRHRNAGTSQRSPFFPGWVRVVGAHRTNRVRNTPCLHNPEEELQAKKRVRRDVEPPEVRRFLRQELLRKVGHSWWNRPRVYRHDLADEWEPAPPVQSMVVIPSDPDQHCPAPRDGTIFSPVMQKSPRGHGRDGWRQQHWNRKWAGVVWQRPYDRSRIGRSPHRHPLWSP